MTHVVFVGDSYIVRFVHPDIPQDLKLRTFVGPVLLPGEAQKKYQDAVLGVVYRRPGISEEEDNDLHQTIGLAAKQHRNLVIMGDFNYPNIQWGSRRTDKAGAKFLELIDDCYLHQHDTEPTR